MDGNGSTMEDELSPIERLPPEVMVRIGEHLTVRDLMACCATSRRMRYLVDSDVLWKPHCDEDLAVSLRDSPCRVVPEFDILEEGNGSLSPVSKWRLSYMRQLHLRKNWCSGRFQTVKINQHSCVFQFVFLMDYFVIAVFEFKLEFIDLRLYGNNDQMYLQIDEAEKAFDPIHFLESSGSVLRVTPIKETLVVILEEVAQVYYIDFSARAWFLKHSFFLSEHSFPMFSDCSLVVGRYFLGVPDSEATILIWDIDTGVKIKEQKCPIENYFEDQEENYIHNMKSVDSLNVAVDISISTDDNFACVYRVFDLSKMDYYPFKVVEFGSYEDKSMIVDDFICIPYFEFRIKVYNYKSAEAIMEDCGPCPGLYIEALDHNFLFLILRDLYLFDVLTFQVKPLGLSDVDKFDVIADGVLEVHKNSGTIEIWKKDATSLKLNKIEVPFSSDEGGKVNNISTVYIDKTKLLYFW